MSVHSRRFVGTAGVLAAIVASPHLRPATIVRAADEPAMVHLPAGSYAPLYAVSAPSPTGAQRRARQRVSVAGFWMDVHPVTNGEFLEFVRAHPEWRRSRVAPLFADAAYLVHWQADLVLGDRAPADSPVVNVSWFAARAYLASTGKRLPTQDEWEYAAAANETSQNASRDRAFLARLLTWYSQPQPDPAPAVHRAARNVHGVKGLHDLVREWTEDFNSALVTGESRADSARDRSRYCGSGSIGAADFENYASFMRYAFRSSLEARY